MRIRTWSVPRWALGAALAVSLATFGFACGSDEGNGEPKCEGAACVDGGSESSTPEGSTSDGPVADSPTESGDAGACRLQEAGATDGGALQWASNFGTTGNTTSTNVAIDSSTGDVVVVGLFWGTLDFGGGVLSSQAPNISGSDVFVARFDKNGVHRWAKAFGNGLLTGAIGLAIDPAGNVAVGGSFRGSTLDIGGGALSSAGKNAIFVAEYDASGNHRWSKGFSAPNEFQDLTSLAADSAGNILIAGEGTSVDFGGGAVSGYYIAKFGSNGSHVWSRAFPATSSGSSPSLAVDWEGNVLLAGSFVGIANFGGGSLTGTGGGNAFVAKYGPSGAFTWAKQYAPSPTIPSSVSESRVSNGGLGVDDCGNILVGGTFGTQTGAVTVDLGAGPLAAPDDTKSYAYLAKLAPNGVGIWSKAFVGSNGGNAPAFGGLSVAVDGTGGPSVATRLMGGVGFQSSADFGGGVVTSSGRGSVVVAGFDSAGAFRWAHGAGSPSTATASSPARVGVAARGLAVAVAGAFSGCTSTCSTAPPGTTLVLAGKTLTGTSGQDLFIGRLAR